jgi:hypothetical protein
VAKLHFRIRCFENLPSCPTRLDFVVVVVAVKAGGWAEGSDPDGLATIYLWKIK